MVDKFGNPRAYVPKAADKCEIGRLADAPPKLPLVIPAALTLEIWSRLSAADPGETISRTTPPVRAAAKSATCTQSAAKQTATTMAAPCH